MRPLRFSLLALPTLVATTLLAQPVIDGRYAPITRTAGTFLVEDPDTLAAVDTGANRTWDYSHLGSASIFTLLARPQGPQAANTVMNPFTSALRFQFGTEAVHFYRNATADGLYESGAFFGGDEYDVSERQQILLKYGLNFGAFYADSSRRRYNANGVDDGVDFIADTICYVGYGTLILPNNQLLSDAVLIRRKSWATDASGAGYQFNDFDYEWYVPNGTGWPALSLSCTIDTLDPQNNAYSVLYQNQIVTANAPLAQGQKLVPAPSPARDHFRIEGLLADRIYQVTILGTDGSEHLRQAGVMATSVVDVSALPPGAYVMRVSAGGSPLFVKLVKE